MRHVFVDAVRRRRDRVDLPARLELDAAAGVRRVAVDLVGRREDERRLGQRVARRLEQVQRAVGVDREIGLGLARRPVVRRLRGGVDDARWRRRAF